jgi:rubrerythrin
MSTATAIAQQPTRARGALRELAADPSARRRFLRMMGGLGAVSAFAILVAAGRGDDGANAGSAAATTGEAATGGDLEIVQYALVLEHIEADFYDAVIDAGVLAGGAIAETAKTIRDDEQEHVDALTATVERLGGRPARPRTTFDAVLAGGPDRVLQTAAEIENLGAAAYLGQAGRIRSEQILATALAIHAVEGRHAATLDHAAGRRLVPDGAFARPASMAQVFPKVRPFLA